MSLYPGIPLLHYLLLILKWSGWDDGKWIVWHTAKQFFDQWANIDCWCESLEQEKILIWHAVIQQNHCHVGNWILQAVHMTLQRTTSTVVPAWKKRRVQVREFQPGIRLCNSMWWAPREKLDIEINFPINIAVVMLMNERMNSMNPHSMLKYTRTDQQLSVTEGSAFTPDNCSSYLKTNISTGCHPI